ncbi:MAG: hypothetical protein RL641_378 [Candidatus Parcubacteria bacterium]|jgi:hypothetical protein
MKKKSPLSDILPGSILLAAPPFFLEKKNQKHKYAVMVVVSKSKFEIEALTINFREESDDRENGCREITYYSGGSDMKTQSYILHALPHEIGSEKEIFGGLHVGGNITIVESLAQLQRLNQSMIRVCKGQTSWLPKELSKLLKTKQFIVADGYLDENLLFSLGVCKDFDPDFLWGKMYEARCSPSVITIAMTESIRFYN